MSPPMKLSSVPEVVVVARVSRSGQATARAGDLEGMSAPVRPGGPAIAVSIASVVSGR
jgi:cytochrome c-type biogenesis protein CcmH